MGSTADQYQDRPAGLLLWFVLVCRVMPRSLMFQDKLQLYKAKVPYLTVVSVYSCMSTRRWSLICSDCLQQYISPGVLLYMMLLDQGRRALRLP